MKQSKKFAVTGGIGSGKSCVLSMLSEMGYPVFSCDEISRALWKDERYLARLKDAFPQCVREGKIDKGSLTQLVFSDQASRLRLEKISHPIIMQTLLGQMERCAVSFAEVPLLYEGGYERLFDGVLLVKRDEGARIAAVMARDGCAEEDVRRRMGAQSAHDGRENAAILNNNGSKEALLQSLKEALKAFGV